MVELNGKKILVTFLMHLGDLTLTTPFIHALRKAAPDSHITMLATHCAKPRPTATSPCWWMKS